MGICLIAAVVAEPEAEASPESYHGYGYGYYRGKRSADADPAVFYGAYAPYAAYGYGYAPYAYAPYRLAAAGSFQHVSTPAATYGIHQLHKREAEADAEPEAYYGRYGYRYPGYGYGYRAGYYGYPYGRYGYHY